MRFKIATNHSKTPKQQQQRARLKRCVELCDLFSPAIAVGFPTAPVRWSAYNAFVETNMQAVTADEAGNVNVDYERILVSKGKLMMPESLQMAWSEADHTLTFTPTRKRSTGRISGQRMCCMPWSPTGRKGFPSCIN